MFLLAKYKWLGTTTVKGLHDCSSTMHPFFECCNLTVPLFRLLATETRTRRSKDCENAAKTTPHINCTPPAHQPHIKRSSKRRLLCTSIPGNTIAEKRTWGTLAGLLVRFLHLPVARSLTRSCVDPGASAGEVVLTRAESDDEAAVLDEELAGPA